MSWNVGYTAYSSENDIIGREHILEKNVQFRAGMRTLLTKITNLVANANLDELSEYQRLETSIRRVVDEPTIMDNPDHQDDTYFDGDWYTFWIIEN